MSSTIDRRELLKRLAFLAAGIALADKLATGPVANNVLMGVNATGIQNMSEQQQDLLISQLSAPMNRVSAPWWSSTRMRALRAARCVRRIRR